MHMTQRKLLYGNNTVKSLQIFQINFVHEIVFFYDESRYNIHACKACVCEKEVKFCVMSRFKLQSFILKWLWKSKHISSLQNRKEKGFLYQKSRTCRMFSSCHRMHFSITRLRLLHQSLMCGQIFTSSIYSNDVSCMFDQLFIYFHVLLQNVLATNVPSECLPILMHFRFGFESQINSILDVSMSALFSLYH